MIRREMARFGNLSTTDVDKLIENKDSVSTKNAVKKSVRVFSQYLQQQPDKPDISDLSVADLNKHLKLFWANIRRRDV